MSVFIFKNSEWIETKPKKKLIFVIVPGAGTRINHQAYKKLEEHFTIIYFGKSKGVYDKYPENWQTNKNVSSKGYHLGGISDLVKNYILSKNNIPSLIICGSRGSQVTIGKIWHTIWRGPTINFNAGCLTTDTQIPFGVKPIFITMGDDYFTSVNTNNKTQLLFNKLNKTPSENGIFINLKYEKHMPLLINQFEFLLVNTVLFGLGEIKTFNISYHGFEIK